VLYVTWIFKRSGACFKRLVCFREVVRVVCDWDITTPLKYPSHKQHVPLLLNIPVTYNTHHSSETSQSLKTRTTPLKYPSHKQHVPLVRVVCDLDI
jgi:hypothetical protein